jgi:hypothetical protein
VECSCDTFPPPTVLTALDNCDAAPTVVFSEQRTNGRSVNDYVLRRMWTATDAAGNKAEWTQSITVQDSAAPTFVNAAASLIVSCDAIPAASKVFAVDECDEEPTLEHTETKKNEVCANAYELVRSYTATDVSGNVNTLTQTLAVEDSALPRAIASASKCVAGNDKFISFDLDSLFTVSDNCPGAVTTVGIACNTTSPTTDNACQLDASHNVWAKGTPGTLYSVYVTAQDACGNTRSASNKIQVTSSSSETALFGTACSTPTASGFPL